MNLYGFSMAIDDRERGRDFDGQFRGGPDEHPGGYDGQLHEHVDAWWDRLRLDLRDRRRNEPQENPQYKYNTPGTYSVSLTVTYPAPTGNVTYTKTGYITVLVGNCLVPSLNGVKFNNAAAIFNAPPYNFTGAVIRGPNAPNGNFDITAQSLVTGTWSRATSTSP